MTSQNTTVIWKCSQCGHTFDRPKHLLTYKEPSKVADRFCFCPYCREVKHFLKEVYTFNQCQTKD